MCARACNRHHIVIKTPPFEIKEEGWGEFDMEIVLTAVEKGGDHPIAHDLNFQSEMYESTHTIVSSIEDVLPYPCDHCSIVWLIYCNPDIQKSQTSLHASS